MFLRSENLFVGLNKEDVYSLYKDGRDTPCGNVYINTNHISHIDGANVIVGDWCITLTDKGISKILSRLTIVGQTPQKIKHDSLCETETFKVGGME